MPDKLTVLIVDDDLDWRLLLRQRLTNSNCETLQARNGEEGESLALEKQPDLVLLDIMMPIQDGYQTCKNLRDKGYTGRIVLMSAMKEDIGQQKSIDCQAQGYLKKPIASQDLKLHLDQLTS
ncbi:MAG: response regulator [Chloroflexota bacterium]